MDRVNENICINTLNEVLENNGLRGYYSLHGYAEQACCLEKHDNTWEVFGGERGNHYDSTIYNDVLGACMEMLRRLATHRDLEILENQFVELLINAGAKKVVC